jgi:hypothetical protein
MVVAGKNFRTEISDIRIDEEGILVLEFLKEGEVDLEEVRNCFNAYSEMGIGPNNKILQLIIAKHHSLPNTEARDLAAEQGKNFFIASAVVSNSIAIRLIVNFFNSFYRSTVPFKMFGDEVSARKWLRTFKKNRF